MPAFAVEANIWENLFTFLSIPVFLVALGLYVVLGDFFLDEIARSMQVALCSAVDILVLCYAPEKTWPPATSLLIIINASVIVSTLYCMLAIGLRRYRGTLVFYYRPMGRIGASFALAFCLAFAAGIFVYRAPVIVGAFTISVISVGAIDLLRFSLASILTPQPPAPQREKIRNGWFGPPLRRARFAPGVETGEESAEKDKK